jgi:signal transduction histidine kinase
VHVAVGADEVQLAVDTAAEPGNGAGNGFGVLNMRERAQSLGGTCTAGPGGRGWLVRAALPLNPGRRRADLT